MSSPQNPLRPTPDWTVLTLIWKTARIRASNKSNHQARLRHNTSGTTPNVLGTIGFLFTVLLCIVSHAVLGYAITDYSDVARQAGGEEYLLLQSTSQASHDLANLPVAFWLYAGLVLLWWILMLICQGEGPDLDITRRRHPHWEWLLSHPIRPLAAFSGEFLIPMMVNPIYLTAPVFWFIIFKTMLPALGAIFASMVVGFTFAIATSSLNKSIEIAATLRLQIKHRGLFLGLISFLGFAMMLVTWILFMSKSQALQSPLLDFCFSIQDLPLAYLYLLPRTVLIGWSDVPSAWHSVLATSLLSAIVLIVACIITVWGTRQGLQAKESAQRPITKITASGAGIWINNPVYRKELLWLWRDKAAVLQIVLLPVLLAAPHAYNLHGAGSRFSAEQWSGVCSLAILVGSYLLLTIGPRSLSSEGGSLWIAQTWPTGLESLLKAKAKLWFMVSTAVVLSILISCLFYFPGNTLQITGVAIGWVIFGWGLALKSVSLVTKPSSSGEVEKPPQGHRVAAWLGTFAFSSGVMAQSWHIAIVGIVYSNMISAAMWQNLRARLPYLFDPWSEKLPQAPTLMHAMIGIALFVEVVSVINAFATTAWVAQPFSYGCVGFFAWMIMRDFLADRGVTGQDITRWHGSKNSESNKALWIGVMVALSMGTALAGFAQVYLDILRKLPATSDFMHTLDAIQQTPPSALIWQLVLLVLLAPLVEEYFFRGLLYRALDREMGSWSAMLGSSLFFAIYHPPVSWLPVFLVGVGCAWIFKRSGSLWPAVALHMSYNLCRVLLTN